MKKILLILIILNFSLSKKTFGQDSLRQSLSNIALSKNNLGQDSLKIPEPKWTILRAYIAVMPGYNINNKDSANITLAVPVGLNLRFYVDNKAAQDFYDIDLSYMPIILNKDNYSHFLKFSFGVGFTGDHTNSQVHASYLHNFSNISDMYGFGYDLETISIPLSIDLLKPFNSKNYYFLIGLKVPIVTF